MQITPCDDLIENASDTALLREIKCQITFLSRIYRDVMVMYYLDEMKTSEIAQRLHISETAVKQRLFFARISIKKEVEKMDVSNITLKPVRIQYLGSGHPVGNDPSIKAERTLSQNLIYLCKDTPRSPKELSELLNIPMPYIEEELEIQCRGANEHYGLLRKLDNGKYISNFILVDAKDIYKVKNAFLPLIDSFTDRLKAYLEARKDRILSFPFLHKQEDLSFVTWSLISRMVWGFRGSIVDKIKKEYMSDVKILEREFTVFGIALNSGEGLNLNFYGCDGNIAYNICGYKAVNYTNIYGKHIEKHFSCGHNAMDPIFLFMLKNIHGIFIDDLTKEEEEELAAKAISNGLMKKQDNILLPKILVFKAENQNSFFAFSDDFYSEVNDLASEAAKTLYEYTKKLVPTHVINEYNHFIGQTTTGFLGDVIDACIEKGILNKPENRECNEGTWLILAE